MVCTADDLLGWKDFPKGLKVLLLDRDHDSAMKMRSKLEGMDYIVSTFCDENEALSAISNKSRGYHVAIIEVSTQNNGEVFKLLETAKDMPTIMISNLHCLSTMMKCIALGAVEFLQKPLSDDKLRNIWQHVVHKAFNAGGEDVSKSLKPVKDSVISMLQLQLEKGVIDKQVCVKEELRPEQENNHDQLSGSDKYPAPSTPQLKQGERSLDDRDCHDQTNFSAEPESGDHDGECKSVDTTAGNSISESTTRSSPPPVEAVIKEEHESTYGGRNQKNAASSEDKDHTSNTTSNAVEPNRVSSRHDSCGTKASKKKSKVDWTPELHKKFVQAVEQLGVDQAIPSRILELMKVEGLTRHNVASHLQKYRMHRRHILPKEDERKWPRLGDSAQRNHYAQKPVMAYPPYHPSQTLPAGQIYPAWVPPGSYPNGVHMWGSPYYPGWQLPAESWQWRPYSGMHADTWGCPVMPPPGSCPPFPRNDFFHSTRENQYRSNVPLNSCDLNPAEEVIDKVVREAISKPWLPLPLGLKPPSTESVLNELSKQGISTIPSHIKGSDIR
ncbi:hypothetical protein M9H77_33044 [Catharanthus roseus]|uniref:Uncharacterized protein n=1 Tax=Catharanthus roseus TaxID=4058 RepID=A0ACC0A4M3_CATRO|nr:hypothetical protein M9H77_33044 [Catharanthus roseus]